VHFPVYAESIGFKKGEKYNVDASESESVKMLSEAAKTEGVWLLGGPSALGPVPWICGVHISLPQALFQRRSPMANYTILRLFTRPKVRLGHHLESVPISAPGELVVTHRKVHLFDIDIPGKITFKVSCIRCFVIA
jgi:omega-amidase